MSQANVDLVRAIYEAVQRRDWDRAFRDQHPHVELTTPPGLNAGTYRGRAEIQRYWEDWFSVIDEERSSVQVEEVIDSGYDVAVVLKFRSFPKGISAAIETRNGHLWSIRDGKVTSMRMFPDPQKALEALGLRE
jgi:ketosteroid isomerase-like protein